ncbi:glycosyltransferase family 4 protein [Bacillus coahuilensis]|nr:glycosyltransferase [Bacillus coahuilensis]
MTTIFVPKLHSVPFHLLDEEKKEAFLVNVLKELNSLLEALNKVEDSKRVVINPAFLEMTARAEFKTEMDHLLLPTSRSTDTKLYRTWFSSPTSIIDFFKELTKIPKLELIPTTISSFPITHHLTEEAITIQVQTSIDLYEQLFGQFQGEFWLPFLSFMPGIDKNLVKCQVHSIFTFQTESNPHASFLSPHRLFMHQVKKSYQKDICIDLYETIGPIENSTGEVPYFKEEFTSSSDEGRVILSDKFIRKLPVIHEMERMFSKVTISSQTPLFHKIVSLWVNYISLLQLQEDDYAAVIEEEFNKICKGIEKGKIDLKWLTPSLSYSIEWRSRRRRMNHKPAVLMLTWEFPPNVVGGLSRHVYHLSKQLVELGLEVVVVTAKTENTLPYELMDGVHVYRTGPLQSHERQFLKWIKDLNLSMLQMISTIFDHHPIAFIHAHDWLVGECARVLKEDYQLPLISTVHATEFGRNNGIYTELQKAIHNEEYQLVHQSDEIIVCSSYMKEEIEQVFQYNKQLTIIPNGISVDVKESNLPYKPIEYEQTYFFSVGRMVYEKGYDVMIQSLDYLPDTVHFVIGGKGPLLEMYQRKISESGLDKRVKFIGYVTDEEKEIWLEHAVGAVFPSSYEPFGIVALEAMIAKKPVIVAKTGGLKGIVKDGKTGFHFEPGNAEDLAAKIRHVLSLHDQGRSLGEEGYKVAEKLYSWERVAEQTKQLFEDLVLEHTINEVSV